MSASVFRALHLVVHACLYAGVATGISSSDDVSSLLRSEEQGSTSASGRTCENSLDFFLNCIKDDLNFLKIILSCNSRTAVDVMHLVVEECTELIQGKILSNDIFSTREECIRWENAFANIAVDILPEALGSARAVKEAKMKYKTEEYSLIESQIRELDEYPSDPEQQNEELKRLFRVTKQPSFTELRSIILNSSKEFQEQHCVLALLLSKFDELPYLACLFPLLRWTRLVSSALTHRISRKEAQSKCINDFINGHLLEKDRSNEERDRLRKLFTDFKDAWNKMREFVNQDLETATNEMPSLTEEDLIGYCLTEGDLSIYLRAAVNILQSTQNNILDEMMQTSIRIRHPAVSFLERNEACCVMSVSLQEAKKRDIISFNWTDEFLKYAQNPEYGLGEEIDYDFERMEIHLTNEIVLGKCYLTDFIDTFIFSKELFHSSAKMLTKIRELIRPQIQSLPDEIRQGLSSLKERRIHDAQKLLQHIEVLIFLLTMKSIPVEKAKEMTVEKFSEIWKSKFPSPFPVDLLPEPRASIKLTHIAALYEALEDLLADGTIEGLPGQFRKEMTDETKSSLADLVDSRNGSLKLKQFLTALRRFVFRYLSSEKFLPEPYTPLHSCLSEPSLWSPDEAPGQDVIPREMTLANIHAIITHLDQERRGYTSARTQSQRRSQPVQRRQGRRRVVANFPR